MKPKCDMEGRGQNAPGLIIPQQGTYCRNLGERPAKHILGQEREALVGLLKERALTNPCDLEDELFLVLPRHSARCGFWFVRAARYVW